MIQTYNHRVSTVEKSISGSEFTLFRKIYNQKKSKRGSPNKKYINEFLISSYEKPNFYRYRIITVIYIYHFLEVRHI